MTVHADAIDISDFQIGALDFAAAHRHGLQSVWHKSTEGTTWVSRLYPTRRRQVAAVHGLGWGAYHFGRPGSSSGKKQAEWFLKHATPQRGDLRPMLDLEDNGNLGHLEQQQLRQLHAAPPEEWSASPLRSSNASALQNYSLDQLTTWTGDFVETVKAEFDVPPLIYTHFNLGSHFDCPLWVARYSNPMWPPAVPRPWKAWSLWQFTDGVFGSPNSVPGIGHCDIDTFNTGIDLSVLTIPNKEAPTVATRGKNFDDALRSLTKATHANKGIRRAIAEAAIAVISTIPAK